MNEIVDVGDETNREVEQPNEGDINDVPNKTITSSSWTGTGTGNQKSLSEKELAHPKDRIDHRPQGGPLLELLWSEEEPLVGQTLYLGGEVGCDGKIYCIPGHAPRVLCIDPTTDKIQPVGPTLLSNGRKYKWLRGIVVDEVIYGIPCHASEVLRIHVPTLSITKLPIPYDEFYADNNGDDVESEHGASMAKQQREMIWKYHGGSVSPIDKCIYAIPQSALHVLKIDPSTDTCTLVGPALPGRCKWYGGVVGDADGAIYGIPHNFSSVLRITPSEITLHGDYGTGGHKWHGAAKAANGVIVCVPANEDRVLCVTPATPEPVLTQIGDAGTIQTGRHRSDRKYKYLGAMMGTNGKVYVFPSGSEYVLEVDTEQMKVQNVGPNIRDAGMEYIHQNKWQNGLTNVTDQCVYAIPLASETVLRIDCSKPDAEVTTWNLPSPYDGRDKWEGGVITADGVMYTVPNNCKAVLKIQPPKHIKHVNNLPRNQKKSESVNNKVERQDEDEDEKSSPSSSSPSLSQSSSSSTPSSQKKGGQRKESEYSNDRNKNGYSNSNSNDTNHGKEIASAREYGGNDDDLVYKSGIPTLRSSAHRVKFSMKSRKHDPKPKDRRGNATTTTCLPANLMKESIFDYDLTQYHLREEIIKLLLRCNRDIVGAFHLPQQNEEAETGAARETEEEDAGKEEKLSIPDANGDRRHLQLENFRIPVSSTWRSVNGGCCEDAQRYLSDVVATSEEFLHVFDRFVCEVAVPYFKRLLVQSGQINDDDGGHGNDNDDKSNSNRPMRFFYQRPPTLRLQPGPAWAKVKPHNDAEYGHQNGELNFWIPLTDRSLTGVDLWSESSYRADDYHPIPAAIGQVVSFHGSSCRHYVNANATPYTRVSLDFRVGVEGYFDPFWQMKGTTDDHGRKEVVV